MKKRIWLTVMCCILAVSAMSGCNSKKDADKDESVGLKKLQTQSEEEGGGVSLKFWCDESEMPMFQQRIDQFIEENKSEASIEVTCEPVSASVCKDTLLSDVDNGADVFYLPDDQLLAMVTSGVLEEVPDASKISGRNLEGAVEAASVEGKLYAYPITADNGYFLYYDKRYFKEEDVKTLDRVLDICAENGKKFAMKWSSGWYLYSFFGGTGMEMGVNEDGLTNHCDWNSKKGKIKGTDVAQALLSIAKHPGFMAVEDEERGKLMQEGKAIAAVSGIWDAEAAKNGYGGDYGACKLPTYTCGGKQVQMTSFKGYRLLGVSSYSKHKQWADKLADYLSDEESQKIYFEKSQHGPSNSNAAESDEIDKVPAIAAVMEQADYAQLQQVGQKYWSPMVVFGNTMAAGNPNNTPLQDLMDQLVSGITES